MPATDYAYVTEAWRVVVLIRPSPNADVLQQLPGPYMPIEKAEADVNAIRAVIHAGGNVHVTLPWLAVTEGDLVGAYLSA